ncbi:MAG: PQQ-binding-like beta-propeller repeat protein [Candidatus Zixiibacteriota bacterium]|nr:MAG: PQQ-binding-like beta-propeller repeat protein [candidate division Zixibacteria bacterium]
MAMLKSFSRGILSLAVIMILVMTIPRGMVLARDNGYSAEALWIYDTDLQVKHVETADLNDDGTEDVIAGEFDATYYGDPSRVFALDGKSGDTIWTYQLQDGVRGMTVGDINNDNVVDVIAGASYHSTNTPDGYVHAINGVDGSQIWRFYVGTSTNDVTIGNFNGDVYMDVAIGSFDDYIYAVNGETGTELWRHYVGSLWVNAVDAGDVNGDNIDDVGFAHEYLAGYDNYCGVLNGSTGNPIWDSVVAYVVMDVLISDIDNDGDLEAIFGVIYNDDHGEIHVRDGDLSPIEWQYNIGAIDHTNGEIILQDFDIDTDGDLDLLVGNRMHEYVVYAFDGDTNTPVWVSDTLNGFPVDFSVGDVTGDGQLNIVAATYDRVQVLEAEDGTKVYYYGVAGRINSVKCTDLDGDEVLDIAAGGGADYSGSDPGKGVWALYTIQSPVLWEFTFGEYGNAIAMGDFNNDDCEDVVAVCSVDDQAWAIDGKTGVELWHWTGTQNLYAVTTGDYDNEGIVDVAVGGADETVTGLDGKNGSSLWQFPDPADQIYRRCLKSTDLNADGNIDVVAGADDNMVYAIRGESGVQLWAQNVGGEVNDVELEQMNASGPLDVVVALAGGPTGERVVVLDGEDGEVIWDYPAGTAVDDVEPLDGNDDGVMDVAASLAPYAPRTVILIDGVTHTVSWTKTVEVASGSNGMGHGDVNDDKYCDVLVPGNSTDKHIRALSGLDGSELWSYPTGGEVNCVLAHDVNNDGFLEAVAGSDDQNVYVINGFNGSLIWNYSTADDVIDIVIGDMNCNNRPNIACVTFGSDGVVYAFRSLAPEPPDSDDDGVPDADDNCPSTYNPNQLDTDDDTVGDACDNCPDDYNPGQEDSDGDDIGDVCDYVCGDATGDDDVNLLDILYLIDHLYGDPPGDPPDPVEAGDPNADGDINLLDVLYLIDYLYGSPAGPDPLCP